MITYSQQNPIHSTTITSGKPFVVMDADEYAQINRHAMAISVFKNDSHAVVVKAFQNLLRSLADEIESAKDAPPVTLANFLRRRSEDEKSIKMVIIGETLKP